MSTKKKSKSKGKKGLWLEEEDAALLAAIKKNGPKNWKKIAESVSGRSDVQCLHRWQKVLNPDLVKGAWTAEEDETVRRLVKEHGPNKWTKIAAHLPGRIGKQCRERWTNHLDTKIKKGHWEPWEDKLIVKLQREHGNKWAVLSKHLPGRTDNAIKNRFNSTIQRKLKSGTLSLEDESDDEEEKPTTRRAKRETATTKKVSRRAIRSQSEDSNFSGEDASFGDDLDEAGELDEEDLPEGEQEWKLEDEFGEISGELSDDFSEEDGFMDDLRCEETLETSDIELPPVDIKKAVDLKKEVEPTQRPYRSSSSHANQYFETLYDPPSPISGFGSSSLFGRGLFSPLPMDDSDISRYPFESPIPSKKRKAEDRVDAEKVFKRNRMSSPGGLDPTFSPSQFFFSPRTFDTPDRSFDSFRPFSIPSHSSVRRQLDLSDNYLEQDMDALPTQGVGLDEFLFDDGNSSCTNSVSDITIIESTELSISTTNSGDEYLSVPACITSPTPQKTKTGNLYFHTATKPMSSRISKTQLSLEVSEEETAMFKGSFSGKFGSMQGATLRRINSRINAVPTPLKLEDTTSL